MSNSIEVINLSKSYKSKQAVNNISFKINENEIVGLLGTKWMWKNHYNWNDARLVKANQWTSFN
jgi:ABC-type lipopolysaccharide export system ATPase subunit